MTEGMRDMENKNNEAMIVFVLPNGRLTTSPTEAMAAQIEAIVKSKVRTEESEKTVDPVTAWKSKGDAAHSSKSEHTADLADVRYNLETLRAKLRETDRRVGVVRAELETSDDEESPWAYDEGTFVDWLMTQLGKIDARFVQLESRRPELTPRGRLGDVERRMDAYENQWSKTVTELKDRLSKAADKHNVLVGRVRELEALNLHANMASLGRRLADVEKVLGIGPGVERRGGQTVADRRFTKTREMILTAAERRVVKYMDPLFAEPTVQAVVKAVRGER